MLPWAAGGRPPWARFLPGSGWASQARWVTPGLADEVLAGAGQDAAGQRFRALPGRLGVYFVLGLCLHAGTPYREVLRKLTWGLGGALAAAGWQVPSSTALAGLQRGLGARPFELLFWRLAGPLGDGAKVAYLRPAGGSLGRNYGQGACQRAEHHRVRPAAGQEGRPLSADPAGDAARLRHPGAGQRGAGPGARQGDRGAGAGPRAAGQPARRDAAAGRPELLRLPAVERRGGHRRGPAVAGQGQPAPARGQAAAGRVLAVGHPRPRRGAPPHRPQRQAPPPRQQAGPDPGRCPVSPSGSSSSG